MTYRKNYYTFGGIVAFFIFINILLYFFGTDTIVSFIGVENTYIIVFIIATIGGLSTVTGVALFTSIATFASGGSEPLFLALAGGTGIFISDSIFYFLALYGRKSVPREWEKNLSKMAAWIEKYPPWAILLGVYVYIGFTPLPNDLLAIALVVGKYTYKKIAPVLLIGSFTIAFLTAYFGSLILG